MPDSTAINLARRSHVGWAELSGKARAWRVVHSAWSVGQLAALAHIWWTALTRGRGSRVRFSVGFLLAEGAALAVGRGNCPVGARQAEWGDPIPFFELVLPPRAAKAAVPILAAISLGGLALLGVSSPGRERSGGRHWARTSDLLHVKQVL